LNPNPRWILDLHSLNERGFKLLRAAAAADPMRAVDQFGVTRRLVHRVARLSPESVRMLSSVAVAQFVPADRATVFAFLSDPAFLPPRIGQRPFEPGETDFHLHYWHCLRAQAEQDVVLASIQFNIGRNTLESLIDTPIDRIDALIHGLRPDFRVLDIQNIEVAAMLIEAEASADEITHLLLCATTASPYTMDLTP